MSDIDTLARTAWGEARNQGYVGMQAICNVVMNRLAVSSEHPGFWWGNTVSDICHHRFQFSCWNVGDSNYSKLLTVDAAHDAQFATCITLATKAVAGQLPDLTGGATNYHTKACHPEWDQTLLPTVTIGQHVFYRPDEVPDVPTLPEA